MSVLLFTESESDVDVSFLKVELLQGARIGDVHLDVILPASCYGIHQSLVDACDALFKAEVNRKLFRMEGGG